MIAACLRVAHAGSFFPEHVSHTLFGLEREEVRAIAEAWPDVSHDDEAVDLAVCNALNNLARYPHGRDEELAKFIPGGRGAIIEALDRWRADAR